MILIVSTADDPTAQAVERRLRSRGVNVLIFDSGRFPSEARITVSYRDGMPRYALRVDGQVVRFEELTSIWFRRPSLSVAHPSITDEEVRAVVERDCGEFLSALWESMDCLMLPGSPTVMRTAQRKPTHMARAKALGFDIAPTIFTNDPREFLDLYREQEGRLIHKITANLSLRERRGTQFSRLTCGVTRRDVMHAESVSLSPIVFQAYVPKRLELRVTVVGDRVFAAEIHSQKTNRTHFDWRRYDLGSTPHHPHQLPRDVADRCVQLVAQFGLTYGTIDLILTPDDRYVFLELNSAGEYAWIEQIAGLPISDAIADLLMSPMRAHQLPVAELAHA
ncbi:MvdC/MvdD family ATP grasp protein [Peristeroidobacter soli]|uniref:MvdC/MvdD family ATP grasp protein n=1 Tax=Peristeroidobacter soli TaxID=2497877 RepID=UPI0013005CE4|nr:ATP-dependent carboxylate-amine ligase [Peristeroidobacter soli]